MRYRVIGADEVSGEAMELIVDAKDEGEARFKAGARGLRAERVEGAPPAEGMGAAEAPDPGSSPVKRARGREAVAGPEADVWAGGPSQWKNALRYLAAVVAAVVLVVGAVLAPRAMGVDGIVWAAVLGAVALPAAFAFVVWLKTRTLRYRVTSERLVVRSGIVTLRREEVELFRIIDVTPHQTLVQRLFGSGTLTIRTKDATTPVLTLVWVPRHQDLWDSMRPLIASARRRHGIYEGMGGEAHEFVS